MELALETLRIKNDMLKLIYLETLQCKIGMYISIACLL